MEGSGISFYGMRNIENDVSDFLHNDVSSDLSEIDKFMISPLLESEGSNDGLKEFEDQLQI